MTRSSKQILRERAAALGINDEGGCSPWFVIAVIGSFTWWIAHELGSFAGAIGILAALGLVFTLSPKIENRRLKRTARCRIGESICQFARSFDHRSTDTLVIRTVYERLQQWIAFPGFPIRSEDDVFQDYRMGGDDFEDLADEVANITGRPLANTESNPYYGTVCTPGDLVRFFMHQPRLQIINHKS